MPDYRPWAVYSSFGWIIAFVAFLVLIILVIIGKGTVDASILVWFVMAALLSRLL